eukprot:gene5694-6120_t
MFALNLIKTTRYNIASKSVFRRYTVQLTDRKILKVSGADCKKFIQGQCTNDVNLLKKHGDSIAAAFLTTKGRIFADALLYYHQPDSSVEGEIMIESQAKLITELQKYLKVFKLRSKVTMEVVDYKVFVNTDVTTAEELQQYITSSQSSQYQPLIGAIDPRVERYGARLILPAESSSVNQDDNTRLEERHRIRDYLYGISDSLSIVNRIPFECNLDLLHYIHYHKGCYVGQELTARTKYKGVIRKRLLPFSILSSANIQQDFKKADTVKLIEEIINSPGTENSPKVGDKVVHSEKEVGEVVAVDKKGLVGIAMMQLDTVYRNSSPYRILPTESTANSTNALFFRPDWFEGLDETTNLTKD